MNSVDAIVLDLDGGEMLSDCLDSLESQTRPFARIIVFDNGSKVPAAVRLESRERVRVIRSERNLGFAGGVNAALAEAASPLVAVINNDAVLDPDWLEVVTGALEEGDAAIQTAIRSAPGVLDGAGIDLSDGTIRQAAHGQDEGAPIPRAWGVSATAALYRRDLLRFDERFFAYYEDVELCARLHREGWRTRVLPVIRASHRGSASATALGARGRYLRTRNRYWVARLHPGTARIGALLAEDLRLLPRGRSSVRGIIAGVMGTIG